MGEITYWDLPVASLDLLKPLWEELREHHWKVSTHFQKDFENRTFEMRKREMAAEGKRLKIIGAAISEHEWIGYCIASVKSDQSVKLDQTTEADQTVGEIESIYIDPVYRGTGVGSELMRRALDWLNSHGANEISIGVAVGNETALPFYEKFGFYPRIYKLKRKL